MTFIDDARVEAERRWPDMGLDKVFAEGAQWAREQEPPVDFAEYDRGFGDGQAALRTQEPTDAGREGDGMTEFLRARLDEDEHEAHDAIAEREHVTPDAGPDTSTLIAWPDVGVPAMLIGPERVLAEVEAKRRIIDAHERMPWTVNVGGREEFAEGQPHCGTCGDGEWGAVPWPCETLRLLALPYADHPEYRQEWTV